MAEVWVARQHGKHGFEKLFALKAIASRFADEPAFRSMFLDEARIAAAIEHPNVAQVFDLGESGSMLYLVMEYVDGESLGALMAAQSRRTKAAAIVPTGVALRIMADVCAGLNAAHRLTDAAGNPRGVVHRDVSPQNILVGVRGDVKVIDFGIAHATDRITGDTSDGSLKGKLHYMAPEQARRRPVGPYTDTFSVGATLYRMLAGHPPFDGGNDAATVHLLCSGAAPPPLPDSVPPLVAAIVERALSHDPGDRYESAFAMQTALEAAIVEEGYVPDVGSWVMENLSDRAHARRKELASRTMNIGPASVSNRPPSGGAAPGREGREEKPASGSVPSFRAELGSVPGQGVPKRIAAAFADKTAASPQADPAPAPPPEPPKAVAPPLAIAPVGLPEPDEISHGSAASQDAAYDEPKAPSMLDVRALVARASAPALRDAPGANGAAAHAQRSAKPSSPAPRDPHAAPALDVIRASPATKRPPGPRPPEAPTAGSRGTGWMKVAVTAVVITLLVSVVLLFLPRIVHDRIVATAREAGVELTIERVGIGVSGIAVRGVTAKLAQVPGVDARADEIYATGWSAREVRVRGLDVKIEGAADEVGAKLIRFYEVSRPRFAGAGTEPRRISVVAARVTWTGVTGDGSRLAASDVGTELESRGVGTEDIRSSVGRFEITTKRTTFGPWGASFDRSGGTSRLRVLFDPPVPDGPSALYVQGAGVAPKLTVRVPRSPIGRLGVRPEELGLPADPSTEIEVKLEVGQAPSTRIEAGGRVDLYGARLKGVAQPMDVRIEGGASGLPQRPLDLERVTATVGPFVVHVTGSVAATEHGFRLDAAWRTVPIACERLARAEAKNMGPIAAALQEIAHRTGVARVTGTASASGLVKYDTKSPDEASLTFATRDTCGLAIFGR